MDNKPIIASLVKATLEFEQILADKKISYGNTKFNYANLDSVIQGTRKALANNGLVLITDITISDKLVTLYPTLYHTSGDSLEMKGFSINAKSLDPKDIGGAITYGRRYTQLAILNVYGEEPDIEEIEAGKPAERVVQPNPSEPKSSAVRDLKHPKDVAEVRERLLSDLRGLITGLSNEKREALWKEFKAKGIDPSKMNESSLQALFSYKVMVKEWIEDQ